MFREPCGNHAAANARRKSGRLKRLFCRLGLWLVDHCCAPGAPIGATRDTTPRLSERASRRILRRIADKLRESGEVKQKLNRNRT